MDKFQRSMKALNPYRCFNCKERWVTRELNCGNEFYKCSYCRGTESDKYTATNDMDPLFENLTDQNRIDLADCTQLEEMLLSPLIPIMTVIRKGNGRVATSGFVANFRQDNLTVVNQIPRKVGSVPLVFVKKDGEDVGPQSKYAKV